MKPTRTNVFLIGDYMLLNRRLYRLTECDDEEIAESYNGGECLPIIPSYVRSNAKVDAGATPVARGVLPSPLGDEADLIDYHKARFPRHEWRETSSDMPLV